MLNFTFIKTTQNTTASPSTCPLRATTYLPSLFKLIPYRSPVVDDGSKSASVGGAISHGRASKCDDRSFDDLHLSRYFYSTLRYVRVLSGLEKLLPTFLSNFM